MAVQRSIWAPSLTKWPLFPCSICEVGLLKIDKKSIKKLETASSKTAWEHPAWEPDWIEKRFIAILSCSNPSCKDTVFVCGKITIDYDYFYEADGSTGTEVYEHFIPRFFVPAPLVFPIPDECPEDVRDDLRKAFALIWSDVGSSGNRVRVAVEALMNERKIPQKARIKKGPRKGKFRSLSLHERIEKFAVTDKDAAIQLMAIKWLGNTGSHMALNALTRDDLLDAFEHFEYVLDLVYAKKGIELAKRAKSIIKKKGSVRVEPKRRRRLRGHGRDTP